MPHLRIALPHAGNRQAGDAIIRTLRQNLSNRAVRWNWHRRLRHYAAGRRGQLEPTLKLLEKGDPLVVARLDRLGRSMRDLANIAHEIQSKGAAFKVTEQPVDTSTIAGLSSAC